MDTAAFWTSASFIDTIRNEPRCQNWRQRVLFAKSVSSTSSCSATRTEKTNEDSNCEHKHVSTVQLWIPVPKATLQWNTVLPVEASCSNLLMSHSLTFADGVFELCYFFSSTLALHRQYNPCNLLVQKILTCAIFSGLCDWTKCSPNHWQEVCTPDVPTSIPLNSLRLQNSMVDPAWITRLESALQGVLNYAQK